MDDDDDDDDDDDNNNNNNTHKDFLLHTFQYHKSVVVVILFCSVRNLLLKDRYNLINMPDITLKFHSVILFVADDLHNVSYMIIYPCSRPHISSLSITTLPRAEENVPPTTTFLLHILQRHSTQLIT